MTRNWLSNINLKWKTDLPPFQLENGQHFFDIQIKNKFMFLRASEKVKKEATELSEKSRNK